MYKTEHHDANRKQCTVERESDATQKRESNASQKRESDMHQKREQHNANMKATQK